MRIRITSVGDTPDVVTIHIEPHWLARLFLRADDREFFAVRAPSILGGFVWLDDKTSAPITRPRLLAALDQHRASRVLEIVDIEARASRFRSQIARS
jgi:hypothetical protein